MVSLPSQPTKATLVSRAPSRHAPGPSTRVGDGYAVSMTPETRYARHGTLHLAYQVLGEGPPDVLFVDQWFSHMDAQWDVAAAGRPSSSAWRRSAD